MELTTKIGWGRGGGGVIPRKHNKKNRGCSKISIYIKIQSVSWFRIGYYESGVLRIYFVVRVNLMYVLKYVKKIWEFFSKSIKSLDIFHNISLPVFFL